MLKTVQQKIRNAETSEAEVLTGITLRSKASWGYDADFMESCKTELTICAADISDSLNIIRVIEYDVVEGFYFLRIKDSTKAKLRFFFIDPPYMRQGFGKLLFEDAVSVLKEKGYKTMDIESDPYAQGFYESMGAVCIGEIPSGSISERMLPHLEYRIG